MTFNFALVTFPTSGFIVITSMGQIQTHQAIVRSHDCLVDLQIGRAAAESLHIDTPFLSIQMKCFQRSSLACQFDLVYEFVATVVSCSWIAFRVLVGHRRTECIKDGARGEVFGCDKDD